MNRMRRRLGLLVLLGTACGVDRSSGTELWAADLLSTQQILFMRLEQNGGELNGTALLSYINAPTGESLTLTGTRLADTLEITYRRQDGPAFGFRGWYIAGGAVITGRLDGAEFDDVALSFRKR